MHYNSIQAEDLIRLHYACHASLVDPNTAKTFRSAEVRKSLVSTAKIIQKVANASCIPNTQFKVNVAEC